MAIVDLEMGMLKFQSLIICDNFFLLKMNEFIMLGEHISGILAEQAFNR